MCLVTNDGHSLVQAAKEAVKPHPLLLSVQHHQLNTKKSGTATILFDNQSSNTTSIPQTPNQTLLSDCKRVKWTEELHQTFLDAVHKLGKNAIPSQIKQVMNVPNLTREQVASHLQKYRKLFPFLRSSREEIKLNVCEPACLEEVVSLANNGNLLHQQNHNSGFPRSTEAGAKIEMLQTTETCLKHTQGLLEQKSNEAREHFNGKFQMKPLDGFTGATFFEAGVFTGPSSTIAASEDTSHQTVDPESLSDTSLELKPAETNNVTKSSNSLSEVVEKELFSAVTHKSFYTNSFLSVFEELVDKIQPQLDSTETTPCPISISDPDSLLFYPSSSKNAHHHEKKDEISRRDDGSSGYCNENSKKKRRLDDCESTVDASFYVNSFYQLPLPQHQLYFEFETTTVSAPSSTETETTKTTTAINTTLSALT